MKYAYIGKQYEGEHFRKFVKTDDLVKSLLKAVIFSEQPYLAEGLIIENPDEETKTLL